MTISEAVRGRDDVFTGMLLHDLVGSALETRDDREGGSRSNAARSPSSTKPGARATRIRRWHGCGLRSCCSTRGQRCAGRSAAAGRRRRSSRARSEQSTPGLPRVSGRRRVFRYNARDSRRAPRRSTAARWRSWKRSARHESTAVYSRPEQSRAGLHGEAGPGTSGGALPAGARAGASGSRERTAITSACTCRTSASSRASARSMRRRSSTRRARSPSGSESSAPNTSTSLRS